MDGRAIPAELFALHTADPGKALNETVVRRGIVTIVAAPAVLIGLFDQLDDALPPGLERWGKSGYHFVDDP